MPSGGDAPVAGGGGLPVPGGGGAPVAVGGGADSSGNTLAKVFHSADPTAAK